LDSVVVGQTDSVNLNTPILIVVARNQGDFWFGGENEDGDRYFTNDSGAIGLFPTSHEALTSNRATAASVLNQVRNNGISQLLRGI
jgi:hypothetical protein